MAQDLLLEADDFPVYPTADYIGALTAIRSGERQRWGADEGIKEACIFWDFNFLKRSQPIIDGEYNFEHDDKTAKPMVYTITTSMRGGSKRSGLNKLIMGLAGRPVLKAEIRRFRTSLALALPKDRRIFEISLSKVQNDDGEWRNQHASITPWTLGKKVFKLEDVLAESDPNLASEDDEKEIAAPME